jgi:hypothetical protein
MNQLAKRLRIFFGSQEMLTSDKYRQFRVYINKIQQDAKDAGIYLLQNYSSCFGCLSHPSSGVHQTVTAAYGTGHSVRATTFRQRGL